MSDAYDDVRRAFELLAAQPMRPSEPPLLSPRCGLHRRHSECRSAICQCHCHAIDIDAYLEAKLTPSWQQRATDELLAAVQSRCWSCGGPVPDGRCPTCDLPRDLD